ncbi:MAG TPA: ABC transporter permease, partial [Rhizobacter sp.]|nr:ABC transporter permease [Rhizobacter sp.]
MPKFVFLWTDVVLFTMLLALLWYAWRVRINDNLRANWWKVLRDPAALSAGIVLSVFALITLADSVHFRRALAPAPGATAATP